MEIKLFFLRHVSKMRMPFVNENDMNRDEGFIANFTFFPSGSSQVETISEIFLLESSSLVA
jgi:hypothetical protein